MGLITTLVIGGLIGWLASFLMDANAQMGLLANVSVGVAGALVGVGVAASLGVRVETVATGCVVAILGAALLIALFRALGVFNRAARVG